MRLFRFTIVAMLLVGLTACVPTHNVKPLPNFVNVALTPGDRVSVTTHDGEVHEFVVTEIRGNTLHGDGVQFTLQDLTSIRKHAWSRPKSPCGGEKPLGCSVPFLISLASEAHSHYSGKFYDACAQHDYCYRHGHKSYGHDREACDDEFLANMQNTCPNAATGKISKVLEALDGSLDSRDTCMSVANDYHAAVRRYGEDKFLTRASTYCEYDGPPATLIRAPASATQSTTPAPQPQ